MQDKTRQDKTRDSSNCGFKRQESTDKDDCKLHNSKGGPWNKQCTVDRQWSCNDRNRLNILQLGNISGRKNRDNPNQCRVYSSYAVAPCLSCMNGGGLQPFIIEGE